MLFRSIGCQLIFSDIGTPGPDKDFTIYDYLKETPVSYTHLDVYKRQVPLYAMSPVVFLENLVVT